MPLFDDLVVFLIYAIKYMSILGGKFPIPLRYECRLYLTSGKTCLEAQKDFI